MLAVKSVVYHAAKGRQEHGLLVMDVQCVFLYGQIRRRVYIELHRHDPRSADRSLVGILRKAMYGTRDARHIWQEEVGKAMRDLHYLVFFHRVCNVVVVIHVEDFLCSSKMEDLKWLCESMQKKYDLKHTILSRDSMNEVKYLSRFLRWTTRGIEMEGGPRCMPRSFRKNGAWSSAARLRCQRLRTLSM